MNYLFKNILFSSRINTVYKTNYTREYDHLDFHPHFELYYCEKAINQNVTLNGKVFKITKPCVIITPPYTVHLMQSENELKEFSRHVIYFSKNAFSFSQNLFDEKIFSGTLIFEDEELPVISRAINDVFNEKFSENVRCACLIEIFCHLNNFKPVYSDDSQNAISPILRYIHSNLKEDLSGEKIAKAFHLSRATLDRLFDKYVGQSLHKTVTDLRLSEAISLLKYSDISVSEVAQKCGFLNEVYFYSFFKKKVGVSPLKYRKNSLREEF